MTKEDGKYGIIVCSNCRTPKTVLLKDETTKCHQCGERLDIGRMKLHYKTGSREEASWAIGRLNAKMSGEELPEKEEKEAKSPHGKASEKAEIADDERERLNIIGRVLTEEVGSFELEDLEKVYELLGKGDIDDLKEKIKRSEEIYEPEEGVFKAV
ncbi:MAG: DUF5817 domain-containing protein [Thermoplasmata archaeon]